MTEHLVLGRLVMLCFGINDVSEKVTFRDGTFWTCIVFLRLAGIISSRTSALQTHHDIIALSLPLGLKILASFSKSL